MNSNSNDVRPKYACCMCGSNEVRNELDTYQVFLAEGDKLVHLRSEYFGTGLLALYCNSCYEPIEVDDLGKIEIV